MNNDGHNSAHKQQAGKNAQPANTPACAPARFQRAIAEVAALHIPETEAEARFAELKAQLPSRSARRMSRLGLMLSHLIGQIGIDEDTVVIYASMFGEGRTLEGYLDSFPQPSPLGFQSSIHPSGVEQALIFRQQPIREFFPLIASSNLPFALFRTLELCSMANRVLLLGGEEAANWLPDHGLAADTNFAFALLLEAQRTQEQATPPLGSLRACNAPTDSAPPAASETAISGNPAAAAIPPTPNKLSPAPRNGKDLFDLCRALKERLPIAFADSDQGCWLIDWADQ